MQWAPITTVADLGSELCPIIVGLFNEMLKSSEVILEIPKLMKIV